jgi:signal transduction histidine kinase
VRKSVITALTIGILLTLAAVRIVDLWWWRAQALAAATSRAGNLSFILAEYVRETFVSGDASLRQLSLHSQRIGGPSAPDERWAPTLASAKAGLAGIGSISVTDAGGTIRHSTQRAIIGQSRSDQYLFRRLSATPTDDFLLNTPFLTVTEPKQFVIPIGRRLTTADGAFDGIIAATFIPAPRRGFFRTVDVGQHGVIWVFHPDGFVLFREPSTGNPLGESAAANLIFQAALHAGASATLEGSAAPGGPVLLTAFTVTTAPPLIVAVSIDRNEELTHWWHQVAGSVGFFLALGLTMAVTLGVLFRQMDAKAAAERQLKLAQQLESEHLKEANDRLAAALTMEQHARREIEAAGRLKDEFLMTVSHELRTPLTAIYGWARMLVAGTLKEDQKPAALQTIERNARMQTKLVDDLLDMARIMEGKLALDLRFVNMADIVHRAVESVLPAAIAKQIRIDTTVDPKAEPVIADPERLQQVMGNLLQNAVKFTPAGGEGQIDVRLEAAEGTVDIVVRDNGSGISPEFLPHVFERFRQQHVGTMRRFGGLGLGLAIVRNLVELHGGTVTAESNGEGHGATFRVRLVTAAPAVNAGQPVLLVEHGPH